MSNHKESLDVKEYLTVPGTVPTIQKMNAVTTDKSEDDESGLGYHHTLVSYVSIRKRVEKKNIIIEN